MLNQVQGSDSIIQSLLANGFMSPDVLLQNLSPSDGGSASPTLQASAQTKTTPTNLTKTEQVLAFALQMSERIISSLTQVIEQLSGIIKKNMTGTGGASGTSSTEGPGPSTTDPGKSEPSTTKNKETSWDTWLGNLASGITILGGALKTLPKLFGKLPIKFSSAMKSAGSGLLNFLNPSKLLSKASGFLKNFIKF